MKRIRNQKNSGQSMLIAVLALGGAMLGATAIAGLLTLYQLRATTNSADSAKAIFAADTGVNWALFSYFCALDNPARCSSAPEPPGILPASGASTSITCYDKSNPPNSVDCYNNPNVQYAVAVGSSLGSRRAFYLNLLVSTTTFP